MAPSSDRVVRTSTITAESWSGVTRPAYRRLAAHPASISRLDTRHPEGDPVSCSHGAGCMVVPAPRAPVAQGIEHRPPEAGAKVRILPGALFSLSPVTCGLPCPQDGGRAISVSPG